MAAGICCEAEVLDGFGYTAVPLGHCQTYFPPEVCGYFANCLGPPPPAPKPKEKKRCRLNEETAGRLQIQLQAAMGGETPKKLLDKYDKDKSSTLSAPELRRLLRFELRITASQLSDEDIRSLVMALDDDGSGTVSIDELSDFIERGSAAFSSHEEKDNAGVCQDSCSTADTLGPLYTSDREVRVSQDPEALDRVVNFPTTMPRSTNSFAGQGQVIGLPQSPWTSCHAEVSDGANSLGTIYTHLSPEVFGYLRATLHGLGYGTPSADSSANRGKKKQPKRKNIDEEVAKRLQVQLRFAIGSAHPQKIFRKFDKDRSGTLSADELRRLIRVELRVPPERLSDADVNVLCAALDDDSGGDLSIDELIDFVERGSATFYSGPIEHYTEEQPSGSDMEVKPSQDTVGSGHLDSFSRRHNKRRQGAQRESLNKDGDANQEYTTREGFPIIPGGSEEGELDWSRPALFNMSRGLVKSRAVAKARKSIQRERQAGNAVFGLTWPLEEQTSLSSRSANMRSGCTACLNDTAPAALSARGPGEEDPDWNVSTPTTLNSTLKPRNNRPPRILTPLASPRMPSSRRQRPESTKSARHQQFQTPDQQQLLQQHQQQLQQQLQQTLKQPPPPPQDGPRYARRGRFVFDGSSSLLGVQ